MNVLTKYKFEFLGALIGAGLGYTYYFYVGCVSGTCAITSSPVNATLYGAVMGYLLLSMFKKKEKNKKDD